MRRSYDLRIGSLDDVDAPLDVVDGQTSVHAASVLELRFAEEMDLTLVLEVVSDVEVVEAVEAAIFDSEEFRLAIGGIFELLFVELDVFVLLLAVECVDRSVVDLVAGWLGSLV